jgi:signal peptidase I
MNFDFQAILFFIVLSLGLIWLVGHFYNKKDHSIIELSGALFPILLVVFILRSFVFEPFRIPSGSMMPTLVKGDFILVKKYAYDLRLPVTNRSFWNTNELKRGDVVVFDYPCDTSIKYIKRLIGLPGDEISYKNKQIKINGDLLANKFQYVYKNTKQYGAHVYEESIGKNTHLALLTPSRRGKEGVFEVPKGHYFFMGDNRDNSKDGRYDCPGYVPRNHIVGKATTIWFNWDFSSLPEWNRIGKSID